MEWNGIESMRSVVCGSQTGFYPAYMYLVSEEFLPHSTTLASLLSNTNNSNSVWFLCLFVLSASPFLIQLKFVTGS